MDAWLTRTLCRRHESIGAVLPLFRSAALVPLLPDWISKPAHLFIRYPNRQHLPMRVRSFVNFMLDRFRNNPDLVSDPQVLVAAYLRTR